LQERLPLTHLVVGAVPPAVLVCGDPGRVDRVEHHLTDTVRVSDHRSYRASRGAYRGMPILVCSHGIGAPSAGIAFEEIVAAGGRRLIRVGTCGSMQHNIPSGQLIIAQAAVQCTGYGREIAPCGYPAVADFQLTQALCHAAVECRQRVHVGVILSRDSFYAGGHPQLPLSYSALSEMHVLAVEMECAALFLVGSLRGVQTAAILAVDGVVLDAPASMDGYNPEKPEVGVAIDAEIRIALEALLFLEALK
jgi:uridine phosphorylase